jgi:hypothetical protein
VDETAKTTVFCTNYLGGGGPFQFPWYNGSTWAMESVAGDLSITLDATNTVAGGNYDAFLYDNSGTMVLCYGPAWTSASARGTGSGTTQLGTVSGQPFQTNAVSITCRQASGTAFTVPANEATYVGGIHATANGQTGMQYSTTSVAGGSNPCLCVYNAYHQQTLVTNNVDANVAYTYATATWRQLDNSTGNQVNFFDGLGLSSFTANISEPVSGAGALIGLNVDSVSASPTAFNYVTTAAGLYVQDEAKLSSTPLLGYHSVIAEEKSASGGTSITFSPISQLGGFFTLQINM